MLLAINNPDDRDMPDEPSHGELGSIEIPEEPSHAEDWDTAIEGLRLAREASNWAARAGQLIGV